MAKRLETLLTELHAMNAAICALIDSRPFGLNTDSDVEIMSARKARDAKLIEVRRICPNYDKGYT